MERQLKKQQPKKVISVIEEAKNQYKPGLTVRDVPSRGLSSRVMGIKTHRIHHLLSRNELNCFYIFDWSETITDIQEQYLLPLDETLSIAKHLRLKHPINPKTKELVPLSLDFRLLSQVNANTTVRAISVKPSSELDIPRVQEKQEIERSWCEAHGISWRLVTDQVLIDKAAEILNIEWFHDAYHLENYPLLSDWLDTIEDCLYQSLLDSDKPLSLLTTETDKKLGLPHGTSLTAVRHLIVVRKWQINMSIRANPSLPLAVSRNPLKSD